MHVWIDSHCHLDAAEFLPDTQAVRSRASALGVAHCVIPAVAVANFDAVRGLAQRFGDSYALGIHPLSVPAATDADLATLAAALARDQNAPRLVAVGEIGLDFGVHEGAPGPLRERQIDFYRAQLELAQRHALPVLLHVRRSADALLQGLRRTAVSGGIAHAFNGSEQQARAFLDLGFKLGFGGAMTYERALQLRRLATTLPLSALVLETDAPDMPPHWLYTPAAQRAAGQPQGRNEPGELPRMAQVLAQLRGISVHELAQASTRNVLAVLPRVAALLRPPALGERLPPA